MIAGRNSYLAGPGRLHLQAGTPVNVNGWGLAGQVVLRNGTLELGVDDLKEHTVHPLTGATHLYSPLLGSLAKPSVPDEAIATPASEQPSTSTEPVATTVAVSAQPAARVSAPNMSASVAGPFARVSARPSMTSPKSAEPSSADASNTAEAPCAPTFTARVEAKSALRGFTRAQDRLLAALGHLVPAADLRDEREERGHVLPHAGHTHQVLKARLKDGVERAEVVQQCVRELVDIAPRHGVKQQQFEHTVVIKIIEPAAHEARLHAGAVAVMHAHKTAPRRSPYSPRR